MSEEPGFVVPLDGVDVGFRQFSSGQLIMLQRVLRNANKQARKVGEEQAMLNMIMEMLDIIEPNVISEDDLEHMLTAMRSGKVNVPEIMLIIRQGKPLETPEDDDADPKPRANKTRTKKS